MSNKVGLFKRLLVNFYDLILLFAVLYFFTIPIILLSKGNAVLGNIFYQTYLIGIIFLLVQGISELLKSYWAAKKGEWPGETK